MTLEFRTSIVSVSSRSSIGSTSLSSQLICQPSVSSGTTEPKRFATRAAKLLIAEGQLQRAYQILFLQRKEFPLEPEGELVAVYLMGRVVNPKQLQDELVALVQRNPLILPTALARGADGAAEAVGPKAAMGLLGAAGLASPSELRPWHIMRRVSAFETRHYSEILNYVDKGALLGSDRPAEFERAWIASAADSFQHLGDGTSSI